MRDILDKLLGLPRKQKIFFAAVIWFVITLVFFQFSFLPVSTTLGEVTESIEGLELKIIEKQKVVRNLPSFKEEVRKLDQKLERVLLELPDSKEVDAFLKSISVLASDTGLEVTKFTPKPEIPQGFFSELPVQLELQGTFHELVTFFYEISHLPRIVNVDSIRIVILADTPTGVVVKASCRATTFRYLEGGSVEGGETPEGGRRRPA